MECTQCGRWAPADRETGYDADTICPECAEKEDDMPNEPTMITYTFSVTVTAPAPTDDDGYSQADVELLLKQTLNHYAAPLNKERRHVTVDWELMEVTPITCRGCGCDWEGDEPPASPYCEHCLDQRAQDARENVR